MKYGKIICDPEEGKELIEKRVIADDCYLDSTERAVACIVQYRAFTIVVPQTSKTNLNHADIDGVY